LSVNNDGKKIQCANTQNIKVKLYSAKSLPINHNIDYFSQYNHGAWKKCYCKLAKKGKYIIQES
jgi:hypothetical protein